MRFYQLDVFADAPYSGNQLAVFPDAATLSTEQMAAIATEMNLSETTFVTNVDADGYDVRIFTPAEELPFAGHPTLGTAWLLRHLGATKGESVTQRSGAGPTGVTFQGDEIWLERTGVALGNVEAENPDAAVGLAAALGLKPDEIGLDAQGFGHPGSLRPGRSEAGLTFLLVPVRDLDSLGAAKIDADLIKEYSEFGAYCFTANGPGRIRSRGLFPGAGIVEDPGTGSAVACLGIYLTDLFGSVDLTVDQGVEMGRPCRILLKAVGSVVRVGGSCHLIFEGDLQQLP